MMARCAPPTLEDGIKQDAEKLQKCIKAGLCEKGFVILQDFCGLYPKEKWEEVKNKFKCDGNLYFLRSDEV